MRRYLLLFLLSFLLLSCENVNRKSPIPDSAVGLELVLLRDAPELYSIGNYKVYTTPVYIYQYLGYGGILLFHDLEDEIVAFDYACPYEAVDTIRVDSIGDGGLVGCRHCHTVYDISYGIGHPVSGPSSYGLRKYRVTQSGDAIRVTRN